LNIDKTNIMIAKTNKTRIVVCRNSIDERHCEERSDEAISTIRKSEIAALGCASLAMTSRQITRNKALGFSIIELLIALAMAGLLLTAVAVAFDASANSSRENQELFKIVSPTRAALFRITSQLRTAVAVDPNTATNQCSLITATGEDLTYQYKSGDGKLYLVTNDDSTDPDYVMCENITNMAFTKIIASRDGQTYVKSVQISITVSLGNNSRTIASAAVIRKNL